MNHFNNIYEHIICTHLSLILLMTLFDDSKSLKSSVTNTEK